MYLMFTLYAVVGVVNVTARYLDKTTIAAVSKVFLMPLLLGACFYAWSQVPVELNWVYMGLIFALFFSWIGDLALIFDANIRCFIIGVLGFALGHISYLCAMVPLTNSVAWTCTLFSIYLLICIAAFPVYIRSVYKELGNKTVFVGLYSMLLAGLCLCSVVLYLSGTVNGVSAVCFVLGAHLFMSSDFILVCERFLLPHSLLRTAVMLTYIAAQGLLCYAFLRHILFIV
ncbi:MAG: lysoplasmalogenase [Alcaligenaceae bacterium]|nr:lysoplasmalogenase [Alcaligenaceae bacterium]